MADCSTCKYAGQIQLLLEENERNRQAHKEFYSKFEEQKMATAVTDERYKTIIETLNSLTSKVEALSSDDGEKWSTLVKSVIGSASNIAIGYLLAKVITGTLTIP